MNNRRGQNIVEYILVIGIAVTAITVMGPAIKRAVQSVLRSTADQVGSQEAAEQEFNQETSGGLLNRSTLSMSREVADQVLSSNYSVTNIVNQALYTNTVTVTDMGWNPDE